MIRAPSPFPTIPDVVTTEPPLSLNPGFQIMFHQNKEIERLQFENDSFESQLADANERIAELEASLNSAYQTIGLLIQEGPIIDRKDS